MFIMKKIFKRKKKTMPTGKAFSLLMLLWNSLSDEQQAEIIDLILDFVENQIDKTETKFDDRFLLPICVLIRRALDVPNND